MMINNDDVKEMNNGCPVKGGAWLRRFDDETGVEKSCVAKGINR